MMVYVNEPHVGPPELARVRDNGDFVAIDLYEHDEENDLGQQVTFFLRHFADAQDISELFHHAASMLAGNRANKIIEEES